MQELPPQRLSDLILAALNLAVNQKDLNVAEMLSRALDMAMTRNAGGKDFVERRDFSSDVEHTLVNLQKLRKASKDL